MIKWIKEFKKEDWPEGAVDQMEERLFNDILFPLRQISRVPMWPSSLLGAHIRESGNSRHSTKGGTRKSDATDMHVGNYVRMMMVYNAAQTIDAIGGIGVYFNTNTPMFHVDGREDRLIWVRRRNGEYVYWNKHSSLKDQAAYYRALSEELEACL